MKRGYPARFVCVAIALLLRTTTFGQPTGPTFEVASIKPSDPEARIGAITFPPGRFSVDNVPLRTVLLRIYGLNDYQLSGGLDWLKDRYNIQAKAPEGEFNDSQIRAMAQRLVEQRFQLKLHHESKPLPVYVLMLGKNAPKLAQSTEAPGMSLGIGNGKITARRVKLSTLSIALSRLLGRPVIDESGLSADFDFTLHYDPASVGLPFRDGSFGDATAAADAGEPSIFTAIQEQLGLKLEGQKRAIDMIVIDSIQRPTEN